MSPSRNGGNEDAGDHPASDRFEEDVLALVPALRRYARSLVRSDPDGEDLLQDCVEKVLSRRAQWRGDLAQSKPVRRGDPLRRGLQFVPIPLSMLQRSGQF